MANDTEQSMEGKVALLVDDDAVALTVGQAMLENLGFEVLTAENGVEGLNAFRNNLDNIDIIVSDIVMPIMGGEEMYREMLCIRKDICVIFCSGYAGVNFSGGGDFGFISKPYRAATLKKAILEALGCENF